MKTIRVLVSVLLVISLVVSVVGCTAPTTPNLSESETPDVAEPKTPDVVTPETNEDNEPKQVKGDVYLGVGSLGGAFYPLGQGMANLVAKYSGGLTMTPEVTGGAVDNPRQVGDKEVDFGITAENNAYDALAGVEPYTQEYDIQGVARLHPSALHIVVLDSSPIKTFEDIKGKKVTLGAAGSGGIPVAAKLFEEYGWTFDDIVANYLPTNDGFTQLSDGNIDAAIGLFGFPGSACLELASTKKIRFIDIDQDIIDKMVEKYPYYAQVDISEDVYNTDNPFRTIGTINCLIVRPDLDEDTVYWVTKSIFDNLPELHSVNNTSKSISQESASKISIELHPGAKKYWDSLK